ncbi:diacylglycerol kinase epsilon isoform X1 [Penaeus vannamei]|uniref:diacylglycerol kinase epsilon isoform X1 n=2 Tax=Penaeus vannamei TaxID=6689 RepID=UPI000F68B6F5|nr:diacylglycerol kinase epsilon-like isoform X1 [Penaeus vannamei]XP_027227513.1 diacylglycerol kinase epsilon-like isoform X1 [Penaeus vannamei]XP_027227514.1 diacylglycerol kinase epsilon-like isoform X1 [Penaeus vannamei]XP_027227515.1 diacylglycerol kinase epsilon-like isoform X1 [Penaeus vannamei]
MDGSTGQIIFGIIFTFVVTVVIVKLGKRSLHHDLRARDVTKGHRWCYTGMFSRPSYCNICETLIMASDGAFCDSCGVCADSPQCIKKANKKLPCKVITTNATSHKHHWVKGNLPFNAQCDVCEEECGVEPELSDYWCCWCHRSAHENCLKHLAEVCDLGKLSTCIVPPNCIRLQSLRMRKHLLIKEVLHPRISNWSPVIVIGNQKSGSNECAKILSSFRRYLNPAQVLDLAERPPEEALEWCHLVPSGVRCRFIVAGGDGTVCWVLNAIHKMKFETEPVVGILPLGTGNDLSRVLGFGEGYSGDVDVEEYLRDLFLACETKLDRWKVQVAPNRSLGIRLPVREMFMNNYLSIGVDALVTLNFHRARESRFYIFNSRTINKMIYFTFGTKDVLEHECKNLDQKLELHMDGKKIDLPNIESIVVLNIACWGAGVRPWTLGAGGADAPKQDFGDGLLEVFCLVSSFHIAQLQVGLSEPMRLGQCSSVKICLKGTAPMQLDGEPWEQRPSTISISYSHQASVLMREDLPV